MTDTLQSGAESAPSRDSRAPAILDLRKPNLPTVLHACTIICTAHEGYCAACEDDLANDFLSELRDLGGSPDASRIDGVFHDDTLQAAFLLWKARRATAPHADLNEIEQYRMQMAGISTASLGYWKEGDGIHPDYDTLALRDVAKLYAKYDALYKAANPAVPAVGSALVASENMLVLERAAACVESYGNDELAKRLRDMATPTGALVAVKDEQQDPASVVPPFAAPASQHDAGASVLTNERIKEIANANRGPRGLLINDISFARAIEAELASRGRAQGGNTSEETCAKMPCGAVVTNVYEAYEAGKHSSESAAAPADLSKLQRYFNSEFGVEPFSRVQHKNMPDVPTYFLAADVEKLLDTQPTGNAEQGEQQ
jgi:hypothetical protein